MNVRVLNRPKQFLAVLLLILAVTASLSLSLGAASLSLLELVRTLTFWTGFISQEPEALSMVVVHDIRLPRLVLGALIGASLAMAGAAIQGLFRNPLADPGLIGVSSGAALAAVMLIVLGNTVFASWFEFAGWLALPIAAFTGGGLVTWVIYKIATHSDSPQVTTMILAGVAITALCGAATGLLTYVADDAELRTLTFWSMGSLAAVTWADVAVSAPWLIAAIILFPLTAKALNVLLMGEAVSGHLGIPVSFIRKFIFLLTAIAVGAGVAVAGMIGFIGLVVPHLVRLAVGPNHHWLLPLSGVAGATLLLLADLLARTIVAPAELPIGLITSLIGGPFFLWLLLQFQRGNHA